MRLLLILKSWQSPLLAASCALVATAAPAFAADPPPAAEPAAVTPAPAEAAPAAPAPAEAKPAEAKPAAEPVPQIGGATENAYGISEENVPPGSRLDWAERREIRVIQKRAILKEGRHGLSLSAGVVPNDDFFAYVAMGLGYQYYFSEDFALRIRANYTQPQQTSLQSSLQASRPDGPGLEVRLPQTLLGYALAGVDWNLLHGKFGFFSTRLMEFDVSLNFGVGAVMTKIVDQGREANPTFAPDPAGNVGMTLQMYVSERLALGFDYTQLFYPKLRDLFGSATHPGAGGVSHPLAATLTLTWFTAGIQ